MAPEYQGFRPERHEAALAAIVREIAALDSSDPRTLDRVLRRHPKDGRGLFSKSEILRGFRHLRRKAPRARDGDLAEAAFLERIRMKPVRTASGVAPVTVLTRPFPCPGRCIFCPSDVRMPKSYIASEPGARRAAQHRFDPWAQTLARLTALDNIGHRVDKAEVIVLGGTWSSYPEPYQIAFVKRCFDALNDFRPGAGLARPPLPIAPGPASPAATVDGRTLEETYNRMVTRLGDEAGGEGPDPAESATWAELAAVQRANETAVARCVGLVLETRPDHVTPREVERLRRLGATKVQIGVQSLSDEVLALNRRGHDVAATRRAFALLRAAGFKIHAHWMPNLYGSRPEADVADFERLFADPDFRPDELKIYPCSLVETAELMAYHADGRWRPYSRDELLGVLAECLRSTPPWCRVTRVIRDIPGTEIVEGNRETNLREAAERRLDEAGVPRLDIRSREVRGRAIDGHRLALEEIEYATSIGREVFLQYVTPGDRLAGFLRLALPTLRSPRALPPSPAPISEIARSAIIREVHVYGRLVGLGERRRGRAQHAGLGTALTARAAEIAAAAGYADLAVISAVGTRAYYRRLGFTDGPLYQHLAVPRSGVRGAGT